MTKDEIKDKIIEKQDEALSILDELITFHDCQVNGEDWNKLYNKGQKLRKQLASLKSQLSEAGEEKDNQLVVDLKEKIKKLEFMIENGLGWEDMRNDITMPHEI